MNPCHVVLNGAPRALDENLPVSAVVALLTPVTAGIAVAVNGTVVPRGEWDSRRVQDGDAVEIVTAVQGG
jgi:sulfur carrier protein